MCSAPPRTTVTSPCGGCPRLRPDHVRETNAGRRRPTRDDRAAAAQAPAAQLTARKPIHWMRSPCGCLSCWGSRGGQPPVGDILRELYPIARLRSPQQLDLSLVVARTPTTAALDEAVQRTGMGHASVKTS